MTANAGDRPTETEIEDYLAKELMLRKARGESADEALEANYRFGLRLRQAIDAKYPLREPPTGNWLRSRLMRATKWVAGYIVSVAIGWAVFAYFGSAAVPFVAIIGVMVVYGYFQTKLEDLQIEANARYNALRSRIQELETAVQGAELDRILQDFENARPSD